MKKTLYIISIALLAGCGESSSDRQNGFSQTSKDPVDSLFQSVMDDHDAAMSKMGKLAGAQKQIDQRIDSIKKMRGKKDTVQLSTLRSELKAAEDNMNNWMHEFSLDSAQDNPQKRMEYLTSEKTKVSKVKDEIFAALAKADSALKK